MGGNNRFTGRVDVAANQAALRQAIGDLLLGNVSVTEGVSASVNTEELRQVPGTALNICGQSSIYASGGVNLPGAGNLFLGGLQYDALTFNANALIPFAVKLEGLAIPHVTMAIRALTSLAEIVSLLRS